MALYSGARSLLLLRRFPARLSAYSTAVHHVAARAVSFDLNAVSAEIVTEHTRDTCSPYEDGSSTWGWLDKELSSDVAGETGAVCIYRGAAAALDLRDRLHGSVATSTFAFVEEHRATEQEHLDLFLQVVPSHKHTRLLPVWRAAGFALGFAPALLSDRALYLTVEAVETFVEEHYHVQIDPLKAAGRSRELVRLLEHCCADEVHHKEEAAARAAGEAGDGGARSRLERAWMALVRVGSAVAAELARRV